MQEKMIQRSSAGVSYSDSSKVEMNMEMEVKIDRQTLIRLTCRVNLNLNLSSSGSDCPRWLPSKRPRPARRRVQRFDGKSARYSWPRLF